MRAAIDWRSSRAGLGRRAERAAAALDPELSRITRLDHLSGGAEGMQTAPFGRATIPPFERLRTGDTN